MQLEMHVDNWLDHLIGGHVFGSAANMSGINRNLVKRLDQPIRVTMTGGRKFQFEAGQKVGIFRRFQGHGRDTAAVVFREEDHVIIYQDGGVAVKTISTESSDNPEFYISNFN